MSSCSSLNGRDPLWRATTTTPATVSAARSGRMSAGPALSTPSRSIRSTRLAVRVAKASPDRCAGHPDGLPDAGSHCITDSFDQLRNIRSGGVLVDGNEHYGAYGTGQLERLLGDEPEYHSGFGAG
jgi:hypothetical protein